ELGATVCTIVGMTSEEEDASELFFGIGILEQITKKRTKNKDKTTKLDSEWKRL
ncbi:hypothetical protein Tco_0479967, partial [Tanacetum coccineum]